MLHAKHLIGFERHTLMTKTVAGVDITSKVTETVLHEQREINPKHFWK